MPHLTIVTAATANPMGAQVYEEQIAGRAQDALDSVEPGWQVTRAIVRSLRSPLPGTHRLPMAAASRAPARVRREIGRLLYRRGSIVHRMGLEMPPGPGRNVVTLHDVVAWRFPDESAPVPAAIEELRRADAVICVSQFSADEAASLLGVKGAVVVHNGVDEAFFDAAPLSEEQLARLGVQGPFVLAAGGASRRKNLDVLAAAWPRIRSSRPDVTLVLSGPDHPRRTELFAGQGGVRMVGRVEAALVPGLMASAATVVVPSLYEGFGLPALEAMAAGTPVIAANTSSLPEVVGDGGLLVEPTPAGIAEGVLASLAGGADITDAAARGRARANQFTWANSAAGHAKVWRSLR